MQPDEVAPSPRSAASSQLIAERYTSTRASTKGWLSMIAAGRRFHRMVYPAIEIDRLTVGERLELIEQVWDSLRRGAGVPHLGDAERAVIEARRTEHRDDATAAVAWETVRADLVGDQEADEQRARAAKRG